MLASERTPVVFVSHGSPFMSFKESDCSRHWTKFGEDGRSSIKGVVFIGAHWEEPGNRIRVASKTNPKHLQMDPVPKERHVNYAIDVSPALANLVVSILRSWEFPDVETDADFDWHDDLLIPSLWMFPQDSGGTPPCTVVSMNARYDAAFHARIGRALAHLREQGILFVCTGGSVHNLYRNNWFRLLRTGFSDNFQSRSQPAKWATDFAAAVRYIIENNSGPRLLGKLTGLTRYGLYKQAHPTDDHFYPLFVAAGLVMESEEQGRHVARAWELTNMCNDTFVWGQWKGGRQYGLVSAS